MSRPRKNTEEGKLATIRWRKTMEEKYGGKEGVRKKMQEMGHMGGVKPTDKPKGFAANRTIAKLSGAKGGRISRRTKGDFRKKWEENKPVAVAMYDSGHTIREISEIIEIPAQSLSYYMKKDGILIKLKRLRG